MTILVVLYPVLMGITFWAWWGSHIGLLRELALFSVGGVPHQAFDVFTVDRRLSNDFDFVNEISNESHVYLSLFERSSRSVFCMNLSSNDEVANDRLIKSDLTHRLRSESIFSKYSTDYDQHSRRRNHVHFIDVSDGEIKGHSTSQYIFTHLKETLLRTNRHLPVTLKRYDWHLPSILHSMSNNTTWDLEVMTRNIKKTLVDECPSCQNDVFIVVFSSSIVIDSIRFTNQSFETNASTFVVDLRSNYELEQSSEEKSQRIKRLVEYFVRKGIFSFDSSSILLPWSTLEGSLTPISFLVEQSWRSFISMKNIEKLLVRLQNEIYLDAPDNFWKVISISCSDAEHLRRLMTEFRLIKTFVSPTLLSAANVEQACKTVESDEQVDFNSSALLSQRYLTDSVTTLGTLANVVSVVQLAEPKLFVFLQMQFVLFGPLWLPLLVPIHRLLVTFSEPFFSSLTGQY